jgi:hypothetical protein
VKERCRGSRILVQVFTGTSYSRYRDEKRREDEYSRIRVSK